MLRFFPLKWIPISEQIGHEAWVEEGFSILLHMFSILAKPHLWGI